MTEKFVIFENKQSFIITITFPYNMCYFFAPFTKFINNNNNPAFYINICLN